ncbi:PqqD family protein [Lachnospiraceae bacterium WCA-693-APC-MOT-I]|uniref:PqqD family protein n=2 Tax=Velocimicrobium porci TaxID=2606634 RepID=A0A6L5Y0N1_9FIRM|nr:PqqD family protein [Velocimicrobium porci]
MKKKKESSKNYLALCPCWKEGLDWSVDEEGIVTLNIENKGFFNRLAQKLFRKPKVSYIHLDAFGSFIWPLLDGKTTIIELGKKVEAHFGDEASPLYERLAKFFQILDSYHFIEMK